VCLDQVCAEDLLQPVHSTLCYGRQCSCIVMSTCKLISKLGRSTSKTLKTVAVHYRKLAWNTMCQSRSNIHLECLGSEARTFQKRNGWWFQAVLLQNNLRQLRQSSQTRVFTSTCSNNYSGMVPKNWAHIKPAFSMYPSIWETNFDRSQPATEPIASSVPSASAVEAAKSAATDFLRRSQLNHKKKPGSIYGWGVWKQYRQWPKKWWKMCQPLVDIDLDIVRWWPVVSWLNASQCFFLIFPSYHMIWRVLKMRDPHGFQY